MAAKKNSYTSAKTGGSPGKGNSARRKGGGSDKGAVTRKGNEAAAKARGAKTGAAIQKAANSGKSISEKLLAAHAKSARLPKANQFAVNSAASRVHAARQRNGGSAGGGI